jgi:hypothetical protein
MTLLVLLTALFGFLFNSISHLFAVIFSLHIRDWQCAHDSTGPADSTLWLENFNKVISFL